jgi:hypothetical protein
MSKVTKKRQERKIQDYVESPSPSTRRSRIEYRERLIIKVQKEFINHIHSRLMSIRNTESGPLSNEVLMETIRKLKEDKYAYYKNRMRVEADEDEEGIEYPPPEDW